MNTFGNIKTNIENTAIELAKDSKFKRFMFEFNTLVLKNKDLCELYHIYDDLSTNKGVSPDIVNDYINESIEYSQILLESQRKNITHLNNWISSWNKSNENKYSDIDNAIYNNGIRNLESILESKKNIKNVLIKEEKNINENTNILSSIPISSMVKIANESLKKYVKNINEEININGYYDKISTYEWVHKNHVYIIIKNKNNISLTHAGHCNCNNLKPISNE